MLTHRFNIAAIGDLSETVPEVTYTRENEPLENVSVFLLVCDGTMDFDFRRLAYLCTLNITGLCNPHHAIPDFFNSVYKGSNIPSHIIKKMDCRHHALPRLGLFVTIGILIYYPLRNCSLICHDVIAVKLR